MRNTSLFQCPALAAAAWLAAATSLAGCATAQSAAPEESLIGTRWLAEDIGGQGVIDAAQSTLEFRSVADVAGSGGCNGFFGRLELDGQQLRLGPLGSTMRACPEALMDQEQRYLAALEQTRSYRLDRDTDLLYLLAEDGTALVRLSRQPAADR